MPKYSEKDLNRTITVQCDAKTGFTASDLTEQLMPFMQEAQTSWKPGYIYSFGGESEASAEALGAVAAKTPDSRVFDSFAPNASIQFF